MYLINSLIITDGEDYIADPKVLTFSPGMKKLCFNVTILDANGFKLSRDFFVSLSTNDPQADIGPMVAVVSIRNDEEGNSKIRISSWFSVLLPSMLDRLREYNQAKCIIN